MNIESQPGRTPASILVGVLWCLALLSLVVIGVLHTARLDLVVGKNHGDQVQAHYLALAGIEKAKALLYQDAKDRTRARKNHTGNLQNAPQQFRDIAFARGQFRVFRPGRSDEGGGVIYGVSDEEGRLNVNSASTNELAQLRGMTPDIAAAILDWRDGDNAVTPGGAEAEYYTDLNPPRLPRNGPLLTTRELLMVRGVDEELYFGEGGSPDRRNPGGGEDPDEDPRATPEFPGWADLVTVNSSVDNLSAGGEDRVNLQEADETALTSVKGITPEMARAIIAYRGQQQFTTVADLLDVPPVQNQNVSRSQGNQAQATQSSASGNATGGSVNGVISQDLLMDIADELTLDSNQSQPGAINVNSAGIDVLACLPGVSRDLAQAIISHRQSDGYFANIAGLLKVPGLTREIFKGIAPRITVRSETMRIVSEGRITSTGARARIEVIVHVGLRTLDTLSYREDL